MQLRIGISGWRYPSWRGDFYPEGLAQRRELEFASRHFNSIEINGSFYSLQRPPSYLRWREETPPGFQFSVKGGRFITHLLRLRHIETPVANFFASGVLALQDKLGPILWQFPEQLPFDARFEAFLRRLPHDTEAAARLARRHDARLDGRVWTDVKERAVLRHAVEVRHPSFCCPEFIALLRRHGVALVVADTAGRFPYLEDVTADFMYLRLHGDVKLYESGYTREALLRWARRIRAWQAGGEPRGAVRVAAPAHRSARGRDVYAYFDNDAQGRAPYDAQELSRLLGVVPLRETGQRAVGSASLLRSAV